MVKICPVSDKQINENISRLNAGITVLLSLAYFFTSSPLFPGLIFLDFLLRNFFEGKYNPVIRMNQFIADSVALKVHLINAGPKIFAARLGLLLSGTAVVLTLFSLNYSAMAIIAILTLFSFLEGVFGFCVACKIYPFLKSRSL